MLNQMVNSNNAVAVAATLPTPQGKDTQWLTLEVCREFQRNKCARNDTECKYAHPPPHVEVQNGRVTACFDSIKGKCQRKEPPCKYLHPPQHLKEVLLQNGRRNLILKNSMMNPYLSMPTYVHPGYAPIMYEIGGGKALAAYPTGVVAAQSPVMAHPYFTAPQSPQLVPWQHYINGGMYPSIPLPLQPTTDNRPTIITQQVPAIESSSVSQSPGTITPTSTTKAIRPERFEPPQMVEVLNAAVAPTITAPVTKKRARDPSDDFVLNTIPGMVPIAKRMAITDNKGMPMYPPTMLATYQQTLAMQLGQPQYIPVTAAATYAPHPATLTRF